MWNAIHVNIELCMDAIFDAKKKIDPMRRCLFAEASAVYVDFSTPSCVKHTHLSVKINPFE